MIKKCVIPMAGKGSRLSPATNYVPKEFFPINNRPVIDYAVEEAMTAGIENIILVTSWDKLSLTEKYVFDIDCDDNIDIVVQSEPKGLGHAILCAKDTIGDDDFAVILPDDVAGRKALNPTVKLIECYENYNASIIGVRSVKSKLAHNYGIVHAWGDGLVESIEEKPTCYEGDTPMMAVWGRYVFKNSILDELENVKPDERGEIQLTTAINRHGKTYVEFIASEKHERYLFDCGSNDGYAEAVYEITLKLE